MRIIPKTAKVKVEFFKNISIVDIVIAIIAAILELLLFLSNIGFTRFFLMLAFLCFTVGLYLPCNGDRFYMFFVHFVKYLFSVKTYSSDYKSSSTDIANFIAFKDVKDGFIVYNEYYAGVLQIDPREFRLISGFRQDQIIDKCFGKIIRSISGKSRASLVKIDRKLDFSEYVRLEEEKRKTLDKVFQAGAISEEELNARNKIIDDRIKIYESLTDKNKISKPFYYLAVYDPDKGAINEILNNAVSSFEEYGMTSHVLNDKELCVFIKYQYCNDFEEKDVDLLDESERIKWAVPKEIRFTTSKTYIDGVETYNYTLSNYPVFVLNAWGYKLFNMDGVKVVMNLEPYEKFKAVKMIDRSLQELMSQSEQSYKASSIIDRQTHIKTLVNLLQMLQNENETLFKVSTHIVAYANHETNKNVKKRIRRIVSEEGFEIADNFCKQHQAVVSSNLSAYDAMPEYARAIHSSTVAACFPFVLSSVMDDAGVLLGESKGFPVIVDFFRRDNERVNSNMVVMGRSGSGKSFATKTILAQLSVENSKIFILDPEDEYGPLARSVGGKLIDVGTASEGRINPFHVITSLESDESAEGANNFSVHLQFLEQFFREILSGMDAQALEYLNNLIVDVYAEKGINSRTDLSLLTAEDYPIFDDLYNLICRKLEKAEINYDIENLRILKNFVAKFSGDGRDAMLWNGKSSLSVKENFTVFNFRSLLSNHNQAIANAQMLLVLRWLDNEVIKNRDFNLKYGTDRKIIVAIDEAHVFIDPQYPVALDFMFQLAKRIRKYNGMQIVITQNIKDFVGSQDIIRKSTAIINACQYSFIFSMSPNDMADLCTLYEKAGKINAVEQDQIVNNDRGHAFIITGPQSRTNISIVASDKTRKMFEQ